MCHTQGERIGKECICEKGERKKNVVKLFS